MNKSKLWGFDVGQIVGAFIVLAGSNVILNIIGAPLVFSWALGITTLLSLRVISHGQKNGHLVLLGRFIVEPHIFIGHQGRLLKVKEV